MTRENNIKISVILPVFNVEQYLKECLESVVNQTLKDIEIICVNDGSTYSSLAILNEYAKKVVTWHYSKVPENNIKKYEDFCMQYYTDKNEFNTFLKEMRTKRSFWEEIFSLKNEYKDAIKYKVVTILGLKIFIKPKRKGNK